MTDRSPMSLAREAVAEAVQLRELLQAYVGLEKLLAPSTDGEDTELPLDRMELNALLRLMNGGLQRQIELVETAVEAAASRDIQACAPVWPQMP